MIYKAVDIHWDCDDADPKELNLPSEVILPKEVAEDDEYDAIGDYLSDKYGFCIFGYVLKKVQEPTQKKTKKNNIYIVCIRTMNDMNPTSEIGGAFTNKKDAKACMRNIIKQWKKEERDNFADAVIENEKDSYEAYLEGYACDWSRSVWIESCEINHDYIKE